MTLIIILLVVPFIGVGIILLVKDSYSFDWMIVAAILLLLAWVIFVCCVCVVHSFADLELKKIEVLRNHVTLSEGGIIDASIGLKVIETNQEIISNRYFNDGFFDICIPDALADVRLIDEKNEITNNTKNK